MKMVSFNISSSFCEPNVTFTQIWNNHGMSRCFMETVSTAIICWYLLIFGSVQLWCYKMYGNDVTRSNIAKSKAYNLQKFLLYFIPFLSVLRLALQATVLDDRTIYLYMITTTVLTVIIYPLSVHILRTERYKLLPSGPSRGHGLVLLGFWTLSFVAENIVLVNLSKNEWWFHLGSLSDQIQMVLFVSRYFSHLMIFALGLKAPGLATAYHFTDYNRFQDETNTSSRYFAGRPENDGSAWSNSWYKMKILSPFLWPKKDVLLQFQAIFCFMLLIAGRVLNVYIPVYNKLIVDSISTTPGVFKWDLVVIYVLFKFLQGGGGTGSMGVLNNLRSYLWIRVQQYTTREIQLELFSHLHSLSLRWHLGRKTGEVLRIMDRGNESITNLLHYILFSIVPTLVDILIAVIFFIQAFNIWFGLIVFTTMTLYIIATIGITEWRTKYQRQMNLADNAQKTHSVDSLLNFETVKYYGAEDYEVKTYHEAILKFQLQEWKTLVTEDMLNSVQNVIISAGLLAGSLLCLHLVVTGQGLTIGDYVLFSSYIMQLYVPLNFFGTFYRAIQKSFVDMENMIDLLRAEQEVIDTPGAGPLAVTSGQVEFSNVTFGYQPEKIILKNISFLVPAGKTTAIVGPSGGGKSTIMRLLFRFYDVNEGSISINRQNVKTVTQISLRSAIGIVPQDTVLFNKSIKYNIQYGDIGAPEVDVIAAAKYADIHDKILTFPESYETQVGERGLRLSTGEKQRVAIARTILKAPKIVLLDEATSALDTQTERNIQGALSRVCANRTTIIIAHRLSTIIHADEILVLKGGEIVERGKHEELIALGKVYSGMWQAQLQNDQQRNASETSSMQNGNLADDSL